MPVSSDQDPLVSVAIPLYQSARFIDNIVANINLIDFSRVEIIVSDRHGLDDAIDQLSEKFRDDSRFRFYSFSDGLNWVEHYNILLKSARGKYFLWMPHDDVYEVCYIPKLVGVLEENPSVILAFGRIDTVVERNYDDHGFVFVPPPISANKPWTILTALKLLIFWNYGIAIRGVFRRDIVVKSRLFIRPTHGLIGSDVWWGFGLSLVGRFQYVEHCACTKRFYRTSTHANWRYALPQAIDAYRVPRAYLWDMPLPIHVKYFGAVSLFLIAFVWYVSFFLPGRNLIRNIRMKLLSDRQFD